jgi:TldD protein
MKHFGLQEEDLRKVLSVALEKGGDYADLFFEHTSSRSVGLRDGEVNSTFTGVDYGVGVRVISGDRTGYAYVESTDLSEMLKAAQTAARIADLPTAHTLAMPVHRLRPKNYYPIVQPWEERSLAERIPFVQQLNDRIFALDNRVKKAMVSLSDSTSHIYFANSLGHRYADLRPMVSMVAVCVMEQNGVYENGRSARSFRMGFEFLTQALVEEMAQEAVRETAVLFEAVKPKGGEMPVVLGAGGSGIFLHEAIGHAFEADFNRKGTSIFSDRLHQRICHESINVVDDGTLPFNRGSLNVDDEGVAGQKTYLVREGVLTSYLHDRISALHYGVAPTGNGRRESFRQPPIPRMRATYMENGSATEEEIIASVKKGVFVDSFTNGQVQIGAGDFTFFVKSGRLIENGKLTVPIRDINIIGNGPKALSDIVMVAGNHTMDNGTWTCGKDGQSCPVTCGMPSALIQSLTVGGNN